MKKPLVFFDLGQTLIDERDFINNFDAKFLETLNGFGAKIDMRNYRAIRDNVIKDRKIGNGSVIELAKEVCRLILNPGYDNMVMEKLVPEIMKGRKKFYRLDNAASQVLHVIFDYCELGIIANQLAEDVAGILKQSHLDVFFKTIIISSEVGLKKPDLRIFQMAMEKAKYPASDCIMVGDRLDTDICPANKLGLKAAIRTTNSLFKLQEPQSECEKPTHIVSSIDELPLLLQSIVKNS